MPKISEHDLTLLPSWLDEGLTLQVIAERCGVSLAGISKHCRRNGLETKFAKRQRRNRELEPLGQKQCATCEMDRSLDEFDKDPRAIGGLSSQCKVCRNPMIAKWQQENMEVVLKASRDWKERNVEHTRAYASRYHQENKEARNAYLRSWFKKNPGMYKQYRILRECRERGAKGQFTPERKR